MESPSDTPVRGGIAAGRRHWACRTMQGGAAAQISPAWSCPGSWCRPAIRNGRRVGRSKFPTWERKEAGIGRALPTAARRFHGICGFRWGVVRACGAKSRTSSNGAGFRVSQSLHMTAYRKLERG